MRKVMLKKLFKVDGSFFNRLFNRKTILYTVFGVITSIENIILFKLLLYFMLEYKTANFITLVVVKLTAYVCNKNFVFRSKTGSWIGLAKEFGRFLVGRGATMLLDYFGLIFMVELLSLDVLFSKCLVTVAVIVINYFVGKNHVFRDAA